MDADVVDQIPAPVGIVQDAADIARLPAVAEIGQQGEDGQIGLLRDGDYGLVALVVHVAFAVLQGQPFGNQVGDAAEVQPQRNDAAGIPVDEEAPTPAGAPSLRLAAGRGCSTGEGERTYWILDAFRSR